MCNGILPYAVIIVFVFKLIVVYLFCVPYWKMIRFAPENQTMVNLVTMKTIWI